MGIFQGIDFSQGPDVVLSQAVGLVVGKVTSTTAPRSLCEVQADEDDYQWLCSWAWQLTSYQLQRWLSGVNSRRGALQSGSLVLSYAEAAGCLLLLLAAETGRREASEGNLWSAVRRRFPEAVGRVVFAQGQPRREFKDALEAAARKLGLRHVFGIEGTQNYYVTVYLQFGFTKNGMGRLPYWLSGQPVSEAISYLLASEGKGDRQSSPSFARLWETLRDYRRNNIREASARRVLENNPWAISDWTDELLEQAKLHPDLGTAESVSQSGEPVPPQFLSEPKLQWELPERPIFISTVINLADFDLTAERYHLKVGVDTLAMLLRTDTGGYSSRPELVKLPHVWPEFVVGMVDDNGAEQSGRLMQLWNPEEDVELFDLGTGERLNAYSARRSPSKDYGLLVSSDLTVEPSGLSFEDIGDDTHLKRLYLLPANSSYPVRVILTDDQGEVGEFWNSDVDGFVHPKPDEPDWASRVVTEIHPLDERWLGVYRRIRISGLDRHSTLQYIRVGGMPMDFDLDGNNVYLSQEFDISRFISMTPPHSIKVRLGLQKANQRAVVERSCWANAKGVMRTSDDGWEVVDYLKRQVADMARERIYKLVLPGDGSGGAELALMEGPVLLRKPSWSRPVGLGRLAGYGAPLEIRAPYNPVEDPVVISSEVRNPGILVGARFEENGVLCLDFHHSLEPSRHHEIVFWNIGDPPMLRRAEGHVDHRDNRWYLPSTEVSSGYRCVAVAYEGAILGSWWPEEIAQINVTDKQSALAAANMLKWMRAPIVSSRWLGAVRAFAHQYPAQVLVAWLSDEGLPQGLTYGSVAEEQWGSAVREIFAGWDPDPESANDVIRALGGVASDERDSDALQLLLREAPLLMGRVTKAWLSSSGPHGSNATVNKANVVGNVRLRIADVPDEIKSPYLMDQWENGELSCEPMAEPLSNREKAAREEERRQDLLSQAAEEMGVDTGYVNSVIQRVMVPLDYEDLEYTDQRNVETALNTRPFRELLGLRILASLALGA